MAANYGDLETKFDSRPVTFLACRKVSKSFKNKENKKGYPFSPSLTPLSHAK
jgi:hypothetical protein